MAGQFVFGYGSLVNRRSHGAPRAHPARLDGWRREWCQTNIRPVPFLSARPAPGQRITGLIAEVDGGDWATLDAREYAYDRHEADTHGHGLDPAPRVQVYAVAAKHRAADGRGPILMSYLDVVVQGYLHEFGKDGVAEFFATTDGWDRPVLNDRPAPRYSRHQRLSPEEQAIVDGHLGALAVAVEELE